MVVVPIIGIGEKVALVDPEEEIAIEMVVEGGKWARIHKQPIRCKCLNKA